MKIFISWSGDRSKEIASAFKEWIPAVIQAARPYFSPSDIDKGSRWSAEISKELESSSVGLICLTKENLQSQWLMFEAGALSKSLEKSRVCPMLFGLEPSDLSGPLVQFQATVFSKEEVHKLIRTVNQQLDGQALESKVLDSVFEKWWPELDQKIEKAMANTVAAKNANIRSDREILEEILALSRTFATTSRQARALEDSISEINRRPQRLIIMMIEFANQLIQTATESGQVRAYGELFDETMNLVWSGLSDVERSRNGQKARNMKATLEKRAAELEDEIPF